MANGFLRITGFSDELDEADQREIHEFWQRGLIDKGGKRVMPSFSTYQPAEPLEDTFNQRVYAAVCAQARTSSQEVVNWTDLPARVASGFYREILSQINYDALYNIREEDNFPLPGHRNKLSFRMRNNGILAFRIIRFCMEGKTGDCEGLVRGRRYAPTEVEVSQVRRLQNPKALRDRGIRVFASKFGDLIPVNEEVYRQRLDAWRATWDSDLTKQLASSDREAIQASGRARVEAQQDLWRSLSMLFEQEEFANEALALRIMQALDQAAADPRTRALLPGNVIDMLRYTNTLLLPNDRAALQPLNQRPGSPNGERGNANP
jgi:hypothetical protein